ncbi:peroxisome biogenesis protein 22 isoform X2 [Cinnamomum micranthum f. kanehirae]|uniref:Peroxisome biogenesis protein 22 isoform X2 n=1 Tax=Cinnamomum micranthum f. kanehirae TaxID=337451 RepID=A0A3S3N1J1_9MAGN|nr:peroxisome biogenesis protein 22 isoform X2 [Cinnamomum micranthum f. kanehirae]
MAYSITEQVTNVVSSLGKNLNRKISEVLMLLINHKNAGSLGALAGFAIAIAFTWKFLRSPSRRRQSQRKRRGSSSTSNHGTRADEDGDSEIQSPLLLKDNDAIVESHPPLKLTLPQIVRKKLNGSRKMTCQLLGVLLEESSPEELQNHATVRSSVVEVLTEIAKSCDVYLMERILDDESGERALTALENAGLFKTGGLVKDKVLFCSTENGRSSFVRQLEPDWHVDTNLEIISQLARFIRYELHIWPVDSGCVANNVFSATSLEQYFSSLNQS